MRALPALRAAPFATLLMSCGVFCGAAVGQDITNPQGDFGKDLPRLPLLSIAESQAAIQVADGFQVELAAAEPLVHDPVAVDFDSRGRMYVVQLPPYNAYVLEDFKQQGSIVRLEDRDQDGRYEHREVFATGLKYPSAVACWDGGVFVGDAPDLLYLKDTDEDGQADQRRVVLTGFGTDKAGEAHLNSIRWGLDNRFHFSTSLSGGEVRRPDDPDSAVSVRNRGVIFDPRSGEFQLTSGGGQHGMSMDDWGRKFVCSNSVPAQQLMYDDRYAARNPLLQAPAAAIDIAPDKKYTKLYRISPPEPWRVLRTRLRREGKFRGSDEGGTPFGFFTGATGVTIYRGDNWPASHRGNLLVGDVANNLVYRATLKPADDGLQRVALRGDPGQDFLASADIWFRPVQFANAPDGTLYLLDMHRELIEGAAFLPPAFLEHLDASSGWDQGRIYRIVAKGNPPRRQLPNLAERSVRELVPLLDHPNGWHRDTASRLLYTRNDRSAAPALRALAREAKLPQGRAAAISALRGLGLLDAGALEAAMQSPSPELRAFALRMAEPLLPASPRLQRAAAALADDEHPWVRYQLAFSLGALAGEGGPASSSPATLELWLTTLGQLIERDAANRWMAMATLSSLPPAGGGELLAKLPRAPKFCAADHGQAYLKTLVQHLGKQPTELAAVIKSLARLSDAEDPALSQLAQALTESLLATQPAERRAELLAAATGAADDVARGWVDNAQRAIADDDLPIDQRRRAIMTLQLTDFGQSAAVVQPLLAKRTPAEMQLIAVDLLASYNQAGVADRLLEAWPALAPAARARATEALLSRAAWAGRLLEAVEQRDIDKEGLDANRMALLRQHPDRSIAMRAAKLFPGGASAGRQPVFDKYRVALERGGSSAKGKLLFKKHCSACHQLDGVGTAAVGADLRGIASRGLESVLLNVLDPNREVKPKFVTYAVQTDDGRVLSGMILNESANSVTLRQADGVHVPLQRAEITRMRNTGKSFMPEGLEKELSIQDVADLLSFLAEAG